MRYRRAVVLSTALVLLTATLWMAAASARALVIPLTAKQLCDYSQTIVVATVDSTEAAWTGTPDAPHSQTGTIMTEVHLRVLEVLKGRPAADLTIETPGGRVGDTEVTVEDAPRFSPGQSYVVFLDSEKRVVGWREGSLVVRGGRVPALAASLSAVEERIATATGGERVTVRSQATRQLHATGSGLATAGAGARRVTSSAPHISTVTPGKASAGTNARVVIGGTHFGATRGSKGSVSFFYRTGNPRIKASIVSWSNTKIVCKVPARSSSGVIIVRTSTGKTATSPRSFSVPFGSIQMKWATPACTYRINAISTDRLDGPTMVWDAAQTWNAVSGSAFRFSQATAFCDTTTWQHGDGHNDIFWSSTLLSAGVLAATWREGSNGTRTGFDMCFNDQYSWGDGLGGTYDIETVALHELGHVVGLSDLYGRGDVSKVMYGKTDPGEIRRVPTPSDAAGARWLYPAAPAGDIAYSRYGVICTIAPDGLSGLQLTSGVGWDSNPTWAPDRKSIAFIRRPAEYSEETELWVTNVAGTEAHQLVYSGPSITRGTQDLAWSPDGRYIAGGCNQLDDSSDVDVTVLDLQTMQSRVVHTVTGLPYVSSVDWSPDSRRLLVCTKNADPGLTMLLDVASGQVLHNYDFGDDTNAYCGSWSPDGKYMLFWLYGIRLWPTLLWSEVRTPDGKLVKTLDGLGYYFDYSPDGSQYVYVANYDDGLYLARARSDGTEVTQLVWLSAQGEDSIRGVSWK